LDNQADRISYALKEINEGQFFSDAVYLDDSFVLTTPEIPFSAEIKKILTKWGFIEVFSRGIPVEDYNADINTEITKTELAEADIRSDNDQILSAEKFLAEFMRYTKILFQRLLVMDELIFQPIADEIKRICDIVHKDQRFILRAFKNMQPTDDYLVSHAVKSTIIALIIGIYIKLPAHRLIELGVASLLHEVGMLKLPPNIFLFNRPLDPQERKLMMLHPILGFNLLKDFDFPLSITIAALEHHERENGTGYPRKTTGERISLYSKIISVACSYEAISSLRPHKEALDGYTSMLELLKNEGKQYDDTIIRALVFSLSIYPIGLYVLLSNGKRGQVIDVNPINPRYPIVQVFGEFTPDGKNKVMETAQDGLSIVRPLNKDEIKPS
jgi:HD-GYP domain-containing protein (c-di-GMP phosphodiesterase class II)